MSEKATWIGVGGIPTETWRVRASRPGGVGNTFYFILPAQNSNTYCVPGTKQTLHPTPDSLLWIRYWWDQRWGTSYEGMGHRHRPDEQGVQVVSSRRHHLSWSLKDQWDSG